MIGRVLAGRYTVVSEVGEGGMSRVWRAMDLNTGKAVAVKVLRDEYREDETFVRRFEREAQAASRMTHPNIAGLLDVGLEEDGTRYLVIEYVSGITLKQFIQETGAIRPETAAQIIIRVLAAVQHAHQNGVIHRDIKSQNILIDKEGAVKVSDFGIAHVVGGQTTRQDDDTVMGSVYYFSPEQARGADVDEKSDLYSVGVMFYEMLTGRVPFTGDTPVAIAMKHLQERPVPPSEINPAVSPALDFVVLHAMEKRPRNRYASAQDMLRDVRLALEHPDTILAARAEAERRERETRLKARRRQHVERRVKWMRRILVSVFALILLVVIGLAGYTAMERVLLSRRSTVEVPNLIGLSREEALTMLVELGLDPAFRYDWYDLVPEDVVADQSVAPGTFVEPASLVTIVICRSTFELRVPNVMNIPYDDARAILDRVGLVITGVEHAVSQAEYSLVLSQTLEPGTAVNRGDAIQLIISGGSVTMPRLIDLSRSQAEQTIIAFNLQLSSLEEVVVDDPMQVGKVISQTPDPYREIRRNSSVTITVGAADASLYIAYVTLDLADVPSGTTVTLGVRETDGSETIRYSQTVAEPTGDVPIELYSETERTAAYTVYYDDVLQRSDTLTFSR